MNWRKFFTWVAVIFIVWFIITNPHGAASATISLKNTLQGVGNSLQTFFSSL